MSQSEPPRPDSGASQGPESTHPGDIPAPPSPLPPPDPFDTAEEGPHAESHRKGKRRQKKKKKKDQGWTHPTDILAASQKKNRDRGGGFRCCGCLGGILLLLVALVAIGVLLVSPAITAGHTIVYADGAVITEAPDRPTLYVGKSVEYRAPGTDTEVAILANRVVVSGSFAEKVRLRGMKVEAEQGSRFAKDLEVMAYEFTDGGIALDGELTGGVMQNRQAE